MADTSLPPPPDNSTSYLDPEIKQAISSFVSTGISSLASLLFAKPAPTTTTPPADLTVSGATAPEPGFIQKLTAAIGLPQTGTSMAAVGLVLLAIVGGVIYGVVKLAIKLFK